MAKSLYDLTEEFNFLFDEEIGDEEFNFKMAQLSKDIKNKAVGYYKVIRNTEAELAGVVPELNRLTVRKKSLENRITRLKEAMFQAMTSMELDEIPAGDLGKFRIQASGSKINLLLPPEKIDKKYQIIKTTTEIDKKAVLQDIKETKKIPEGVEYIESPKYLKLY